MNQDGVSLCVDNILFLDGYLFVRGWALDRLKPIRSMTIRATDDKGQKFLLNTQPGQLRETVADVFKLDDAGKYNGFEADLSSVSADSVSIKVTVRRESEENTEESVSFELGSIDQVRSAGRDAAEGVLILTEAAPGGPCRRYRGDHLAEELIKQGIKSEVININRGFKDKHLNYRHLVLQRVWFPFYQKIAEVFKRAGGQVFFEVDDAIFSYELSMENDYLNQLPGETRLDTTHMAEIIALCDGIITSTDYLAGIIRGSFPDKPVFVNQNVANDEMVRLSEAAYRITDAVRRAAASIGHISDTDKAHDKSNSGFLKKIAWKIVRSVNVSQTGRGTQVHEPKRDGKAGIQATTERDDIVTIGYFSGTNTHNKDLAMIADVLADILKHYKNTRLLLAGQVEVPEALGKCQDRIDRFDPVDWKELPELLVRADINLVPLEDTTFNKCKSAIKWLEAALVGVPTVATRNDEFSRVVKDGETGLLCESREEWFAAIRRLAEDKELRKRIAEAARKDALENYTTKKMNEGLLEVL